jgi:ketopantoate reductase
MILLKKLVLALFVSIALLATTSTVMAEKEISQASVLKALNETISTSEEIVSALNSGADAEVIENLYRKVKTIVKGVIVSDSKSAVPRAKANKRIKQSRKAFRNNDMEKAATFASEAVNYYKKTKANKI